MLWSATLLVAAWVQDPGVNLSFEDGVFIVKGSARTEQVSTIPKKDPIDVEEQTFRLFHKDQIVTFDQRGLSIGSPGKMLSSKFTTFATSKRLFSTKEMAENEAAFRSGKRKKEVSGLSGYVLDGSVLYTLVRWDERDGKPWFEAVVSIDLDAAEPEFAYAGRFRGFTTASGKVGDRLSLVGGKLVALTQTQDGFGISTLDPKTGDARYKAVGPKVGDGRLVPGSTHAVTIDKTRSGSFRLGVVNTASWSYRPAAEIRGKILGLHAPCLVQYKTKDGQMVLNLESGAELPLPLDCKMKSVDDGLLVWAPAKSPTVAVVYVPTTFRTLARWSK